MFEGIFGPTKYDHGSLAHFKQRSFSREAIVRIRFCSVEIAKQFFIKKMRRMIFKKNGDYGRVKKTEPQQFLWERAVSCE
jgi:hypothetical protein